MRADGVAEKTGRAGIAGHRDPLRGPGRRAERELGGVSTSAVGGEREGGDSDQLSRARCTKQTSAFV